VALGRDHGVEATCGFCETTVTLELAQSRAALRLGAQEVTVAYRRGRTEMPALDEEIEQAEAEGVKFELLAGPVGVQADAAGKATGLECLRMRLGEPDDHGRCRPQVIPGSEQHLPADRVIIAFGFLADPPDWFGESRIATHPDGLVTTAGEAGEFPFQTGNPAVFAGGDMVRGSSLVVHAVHEGRSAARGILDYLGV